MLESLCTSGDAGNPGRAPVWLQSHDAQSCLRLAKQRVYEIRPSPDGSGQVLQRNVRPHAKWARIVEAVDRTLQDVAERTEPELPKSQKGGSFEFGSLNMATQISLDLDDSDIEITVQPVVKRARTLPDAAGSVVEPRVLIIAPDDRSRRQLSTLLHRGPEATLLDGLDRYLRDRSSRGRDVPTGIPHSELRFGEMAVLAREAEAVTQELDELQPSSTLQARQLPDGRMCHPRIDIVSAEDTEGQLEVRLAEMRPHAVIVFEPTLHAIRALEVYCASARQSHGASIVKRETGSDTAPTQQAPVAFHVYLMVFEESVEKSRFEKCMMQAGISLFSCFLAVANHVPHWSFQASIGLPRSYIWTPWPSRQESEAVDSLIRSRQHLTFRTLALASWDVNCFLDCPEISKSSLSRLCLHLVAHALVAAKEWILPRRRLPRNCPLDVGGAGGHCKA